MRGKTAATVALLASSWTSRSSVVWCDGVTQADVVAKGTYLPYLRTISIVSYVLSGSPREGTHPRPHPSSIVASATIPHNDLSKAAPTLPPPTRHLLQLQLQKTGRNECSCLGWHWHGYTSRRDINRWVTAKRFTSVDTRFVSHKMRVPHRPRVHIACLDHL
jgi:hypothetical protein